MQLHKRVCVFISLFACLGQAAFAECSRSTTPTEEQSQLEDRTVVLTLKLTQGGTVRDVEVLRGPEPLRAAAIKAAKARKYKHRITWPDPSWMMVEVKFPPHGHGAPGVRQALPAGVSSCVSGQPMGFTFPWSGVLPPSLDLLLRTQPSMPILAPETEK